MQMDLSPVINQFMIVIAIVCLFAILIGILKSPWVKGWFGEAIVNLSAQMLLNKDDYHLIKNVTLPTEDGTTQIDQVIVSPFGVFVVETKNMKGWIFGQPDQSTWTQKNYHHTNRFQNPLRQNYKHIKTLQSLLDLKDEQIHSLVVFSGDSKFKTEMPENVTAWGEHIKYIKSKREQVIPPTMVDDIINKIQAGRLEPSFSTNKKHVNNLKQKINYQKTVFCPKCGSQMVPRTAQSGPNKGNKFWGCSNFPQCRGIKNLGEIDNESHQVHP